MDKCANCLIRKRFISIYAKYLKDTGEKADVQFVAKMMKMDKEMFFCLNSGRGKKLVADYKEFEREMNSIIGWPGAEEA